MSEVPLLQCSGAGGTWCVQLPTAWRLIGQLTYEEISWLYETISWLAGYSSRRQGS